MPQGTFTFGTSGASTTNFTNDTDYAFLGGTPYTGDPSSIYAPDWTQVVNGFIPGTPLPGPSQTLGPFSCDWIIAGTGGSGKILSVLFSTNAGGARNVIIVLQSGGGVFTDGINYQVDPPPPCFVEGARILTNNGLKAVETLTADDFVLTSDNRCVRFKVVKTSLSETTTATAPYRIEANAFGFNRPLTPLCLSPTHKILLRKGVWISPERAEKYNKAVQQYNVGKAVTYYHIACDNYLRDNIIAEGLVVESLGTIKNYKGPSKVYTWNERLGGFTRPAPSIKHCESTS